METALRGSQDHEISLGLDPRKFETKTESYPWRSRPIYKDSQYRK